MIRFVIGGRSLLEWEEFARDVRLIVAAIREARH